MKGLTNWINTHKDGMEEDELRGIWEATSSYKNEYVSNVEERHAVFMTKIRSDKNTSGKIVPIRRKLNFLRIAAAVAFLLIAGFAADHFFSTVNTAQFATGTADKKSMLLDDGSTVSLNSLSRLEYPEQFDGDLRLVKLHGEAFFDIQRNEQKPFHIETEKARIEVLGTSFNVRSFAEENKLEVFVKTGSVKVVLKESNDSHVLKPGDLFSIDLTKTEVKKLKDVEQKSIDWKYDLLVFDNKPLNEIFNTLSIEHKVDFNINDSGLNDCPFSINLNLLTLDQALDGIKEACGLSIEKKGEAYDVSGQCCD